MFHDPETAGHPGEITTYNAVRQHYWWPGLCYDFSWLLMESQVSRSLVQVSRSLVLERPLFKAEDVE